MTAAASKASLLLRVEDLQHGQRDGQSDVAEVCAEYRGADATGTRVHEDLQKYAADHPGRFVAAEWEGPLGWTRFLWCRK